MAFLGFEGVELEEAPQEAVPKCPACKAELHVIWTKSWGVALFAKDRLLICPHCRSILGFTAIRS
ncbi:MAG: hypothetical protein HOP28_14780 [Gemmatimonadales bacterium]|nr:hypothetical protein [Gemmatimonadales bacterium]